MSVKPKVAIASQRQCLFMIFIDCICSVIFLLGCDICSARLLFRADINVLLSPKAEAAGQTHHSAGKFPLNAVQRRARSRQKRYIMRSRPARSIALKWSPYGGGLVSATTGHSASSGLEQRRHRRA